MPMQDLIIHVPTDGDPVAYLAAMELQLDTIFLGRPEVVAQRIRAAYIEQTQTLMGEAFDEKALPPSMRRKLGGYYG